MPRSMRRTALRPHTCAMSLALLDQGEMVPMRGTVSSVSPCMLAGAAPRGPYSSSVSSTARACSPSGSARSTKWTKCAVSALTAGSSAVTRSSSLARRNAESAAEPRICSLVKRASLLLTRRCRVHRHGKLRDVRAALQRTDLADAVLLHLVDPQDRMHRQKGALDSGELALDALFGGVEHHAGTLTKHKLFDLDEAEQLAVTDAARVHLINLALIHEHNPENVTGCHGGFQGCC